MYKLWMMACMAAGLAACSAPQRKISVQEENTTAKSLLQGIWLDDNTEVALLKVTGDTLYYADAGTAPVAFRIVGDSLMTYGARTNSYKIEKQGEYIFWFYTANGDMLRLHKADNARDSLTFLRVQEVVQPREVIQKDKVVMYDKVRYRGYVYINPSSIKVMRPGVSEEGIGVDNVYYDNIIHICVYEGKKSLFAKDIRKQMFQGVVPDAFLQGSILSDMDFLRVDADGYHYQATVCIPDEALSYLVHLTATPQGDLSFELVE